MVTASEETALLTLDRRELDERVTGLTGDLPRKAGTLRLRPGIACVSRHWVWKPCDESLSPYYPFKLVSYGDVRLYVRSDGPRVRPAHRERPGHLSTHGYRGRMDDTEVARGRSTPPVRPSGAPADAPVRLAPGDPARPGRPPYVLVGLGAAGSGWVVALTPDGVVRGRATDPAGARAWWADVDGELVWAPGRGAGLGAVPAASGRVATATWCCSTTRDTPCRAPRVVRRLTLLSTGAAGQASDAGRERPAFVSPRRFFAASRRSFDPRVGRGGPTRRGWGSHRVAQQVGHPLARGGAVAPLLTVLRRGHDEQPAADEAWVERSQHPGALRVGESSRTRRRRARARPAVGGVDPLPPARPRRPREPLDQPHRGTVTLWHTGARRDHEVHQGFPVSSSGSGGGLGAGALVAVGPLQQRRRWRTTASSMPACRSPSSAKRAGTVAIVKSPRLDVVDLVPARSASRPCRRACRAPSRPRRSCGRGRSGCSRRRPSPGRGPCATRSWSTSSGARRSTSRAKASAARRTSPKPCSGAIRT